MTDFEAYELMVKYSGGEATISKIKQMIAWVGIDKTVETIATSHTEAGKTVSDEYREWMRQAFTYLSNLKS